METSESDSDNEDCEPGSSQEAETDLTTTPRSSDRLRTRANRQFRLPSRDEVLGRIIPRGSRETPSKSLAELRPRKLVNNLLKVNNRYNYDPDFTDSDTSLGGFLEDEDEREEEDNTTTEEEGSKETSRSHTSSSSSEDQESHQHRRRVQRKPKSPGPQKRRPLIGETDSDSDEKEEKVCKTTAKKKRKTSSFFNDSSSSEEKEEERKKKSCRVKSMRTKRERNILEKYRAKRALKKRKV